MANILNVVGVEATGEQIVGFMRAVSPVFAFIVFWQRSGFGGGIPRPFTLNPSEEKQGEFIRDTRK